MKVCIAEKPSVAREIANILKATIRKDGYLEGNGYQVTCQDGTISMSGGIQGACSHHGGVQ